MKERCLLFGEVTLNEAQNKSKGIYKLQSSNLKAIAGKIVSKESEFEKKLLFMLNAGLDEEAYKIVKKEKKTIAQL